MSAALYNLAPGFTAEMGLAGSDADIPLRSLEAERWDLVQIKAPEAWELSGGGESVIVAVLDSGIDIRHPVLKGKVLERVNLSNSPGIDLNRGHGTHIAGLIAAAGDQPDNAGVAFNARLLDIQVADNNGQTDALKVAKGIIWAADHGARVINISLVINQPYQLLEEAVNYAWEKGCTIIAAAGNQGTDQPVYPAAYAHVIAVAASDRTDRITRWSGRGDWVDVAAPGVDIDSTLPGGQHGLRSGSSFSAALVAGEAALLMADAIDQDQDGSVIDEVEDLILNNCDQSDEMVLSGGRVNVYNAARAADIIRDMLPIDTDLN
jgi:thermitase